MEVLTPELTGILSLASVVIGVLVVLFYWRVIKPRVDETQFFQQYAFVLTILDDVVTNVVMRLAFAHEDLSRFEDEATATGRDVRLVAAMHFVDRFTTEHGIELDEEYIISSIEARLAELKRAGVIPAASRTADATA